MALYAAVAMSNMMKLMAHEKTKSALLFLTILTIVGTVSWAVVSAQQLPEQNNQTVPRFDLQGHIRDDVLTFIATNHSQVAFLMSGEDWAGGQVETGVVGAETYTYQSGGWNVTITYPVVPEPVYNITVRYTVPEGRISIL